MPIMIMETSVSSEICSQEKGTKEGKTIEKQGSTDCSADNVYLKKILITLKKGQKMERDQTLTKVLLRKD